VHIALLSPGKWDQWRVDWVIVQTDVHDRLALPTSEPTGRCSLWEKIPDLQSAYDPMLRRIEFLAEKGMTSLMVLSNFLSRCIAPL
jgi:hypothetical protein